MRLSHKDYAALDQAIFELNDYRDLKRFRAEVPAIFLKLVPSDYFFGRSLRFLLPLKEFPHWLILLNPYPA
jgi:hypothetical protein